MVTRKPITEDNKTDYHSIAYVKQNMSWSQVDDDSVKEVTKESVKSLWRGDILFYHHQM